ncbi:Protein disulfide isomerase-like 1-4 [Euphorbia peplus]|nr:Protein disulfide isomerase-like 1-4 [Euphorbia peplus]
MATPKILLFSLFTSVLLFTVFYFTPFSSSTIIAKALSIIDNREVFPTSIKPHHGKRSNKGKELHLHPNAEEKDVVVLTENNFTAFISQHRYVMVKFYAPWCYWSKKLAPEYSAAATILKSRAVLAEVDCTQEANLARKLHIQGYPSVYFFVGGDQKNFHEFFQERTRDAIVNWVYQKMNSPVQKLTSIDDAERVLASNSSIVLGFLNCLQDKEREVLAIVAQQNIDVNFYETENPDVAKLVHIELTKIDSPALVLLEKETRMHTHFEGQFTVSEIANFVSINKLPSVITYTIEDAPRIFKNPMKQLWLFTPEFSLEVISVFKEVAKIFKGKLLFVHVDLSEEGAIFARRLSYKFGNIGEAPTVVAYDAAGTSKYHVHHGELTVSDIKSFAEEFLEHKLTEKSSKETLIRLPFHPHPDDPSAIPHTY